MSNACVSCGESIHYAGGEYAISRETWRHKATNMIRCADGEAKALPIPRM